MQSYRLQRLTTGTMLSVAWVLFYLGAQEIAYSLLGFVIVMMFIWAIFDFCPPLWFFRKILNEADTKDCG